MSDIPLSPRGAPEARSISPDKSGYFEPDMVEHLATEPFQPNDNTLALAAAEEKAISPYEAIRDYHRAFLWCLFCCIGAVLWGYDVQISSGLLSTPRFRQDFGYSYKGEYVVPARWQSAFNSVGSVGGMFGGIVVGWLADRIGRRGALAVASCISIGSVFMQFFCPPHNNALLLVGKLINGFALGMYISSASAYCAEVSPVALRGITTGLVNLWIVFGQFLANCVIQGLGSRDNRNAYRIPFAIQWIFPAIMLAGLPFAPESPWYLARREYNDQARLVLKVLGTKDLDLHFRQIQETIALEDHYAAQTTYTQCFKGSDRRRTIIALMVFILQQISGVIFVLGYSTYFFQLAGFATSDSFKLGVGVTAIGVFGNLTALYSVNKLGRRTLFLWGMIGCTIINFGIGFSSISNTKAARWAEAVFTLIFGLIYQGSIGPLGYVIFSEVSSAKLRSKTVGLGICVNSLCGMLANIIIPYLVNPDEANLKGRVGYIFGGLGLLGSIWTWFYIPETKNRTVDELDALFEAKISSRKFAKTVVDR
uniref:Major facilitator superfamily (MFS) profile domain-containing protein n=1 Tax=Kwoniella bestiolae CBS 10118 TaxID=1296100 RepID=A0A1B9FS60_9TREE|nr:hypothetical protein I302_08374 [Kwoniella bestiolae CBS 10118]OCF21600.1 hypothetical protein I302_08374 [Kwoniella bestiolae CBS 10118]